MVKGIERENRVGTWPRPDSKPGTQGSIYLFLHSFNVDIFLFTTCIANPLISKLDHETLVSQYFNYLLQKYSWVAFLFVMRTVHERIILSAKQSLKQRHNLGNLKSVATCWKAPILTQSWVPVVSLWPTAAWEDSTSHPITARKATRDSTVR